MNLIVLGSEVLRRTVVSAGHFNSSSWIIKDCLKAMLVYRTIAKKFFWEFDYVTM